MTNKPLVSVIMPFYNGHQYIGQAVRSVLGQTYSNFELLIVNDGSSAPAPEELLSELDCSKIKFLKHEKNAGLSATRNTGHQASSGEFVLPLDCDDQIAPQFLTDTVEILSRQPDIDAVYTQVEIFGDTELTWIPKATMLGIMCGDPVPSTILYRRNVFDVVGGYNTEIKCVPDVDFWIRALSKGVRLHRLEKPLYFYRKHTNSLSELGQLTEVSTLAAANRELYEKHLIDVLELQEQRYFELKNQYAELESGFKLMQDGYHDLLRRYDDVVSKLQQRSIRYHLRKLMHRS